MIGYFGREGYKLLDRTSGAIHKSRDMIFEEGSTHIAQQPTPTVFSDDDDPFSYQPIDRTAPHQGELRVVTDADVDKGPGNLPQHGVALRPVALPDLHKDSPEVETEGAPGAESKGEATEAALPVVRRSQRESRLSTRLKESMEYLQRTSAHVASDDTWLPKSYREAMTRPDLWWEPMNREIEMLRE